MNKLFSLKFLLLALAAVGMLSISSCGKGENEVDGNEVVEKEICNECHCQVENPLTELEWLKKEIERYDNADVALTVYSCKYKIATDTIYKDGFVIECGFRDLYDCEGNLLTILQGDFVAPDTNYNVDYNSFQVIYDSFYL